MLSWHVDKAVRMCGTKAWQHLMSNRHTRDIIKVSVSSLMIYLFINLLMGLGILTHNILD